MPNLLTIYHDMKRKISQYLTNKDYLKLLSIDHSMHTFFNAPETRVFFQYNDKLRTPQKLQPRITMQEAAPQKRARSTTEPMVPQPPSNTRKKLF